MIHDGKVSKHLDFTGDDVEHDETLKTYLFSPVMPPVKCHHRDSQWTWKKYMPSLLSYFLQSLKI